MRVRCVAAVAQARLTAHYSVHRGFVNEEEEGLLGAADALRHIRCIAVQGGNDLICPPATAFALHEAWPELELRVVPGSGHSMYDQGLQAEVLRATDLLRDVVRVDDVMDTVIAQDDCGAAQH